MTQRFDLAGTPTSVSAARSFVRAVLEAQELDHLVDTAALLVSELATNAVLHARTSYRVEVGVGESAVRVSVLDLSPVLVHRRVNALESGTGRGLGLVEVLAERWGPTPSEDLDGHAKGIWFELPLDPALLAEPEDGALYRQA